MLHLNFDLTMSGIEMVQPMRPKLSGIRTMCPYLLYFIMYNPILLLSPHNLKDMSSGYCSAYHLQVAQNLR